MVIPSTDWSVEALARVRARSPELASVALAAPEPLARAGSKEETLRVATELGLASPRSIAVTSGEEARAAVARLGLPVVLKPLSSWRPVGAGGERVGPVYLAREDAVDSFAAALVRADAPVLVQEFAVGVRETVKLFRADGCVQATLVMRIARTWPLLGGSSVMRETIAPEPALVEAAERLVAAIGLEGYAEVEFRRDRSGRPLLMEVNARLSQSVELALRAGVDFPRMQYDWARGEEIVSVGSYRVGVRLGWLAGDMRIVADAALRPGRRSRLPAALRDVTVDYLGRRSRLDGFDASDPRPMLAAVAFTLSGGRGRRSPS